MESLTISRPVEQKLDATVKRAFEASENDFKADFERWFSKQDDMKEFLWENYRVVMLPIATFPKDRDTQFQVFRQSIVRHVSIFIGDYQRAGGTGKRQFPIPECSEIGLGRDDNEVSSSVLDSVAGSQGDIKFKQIPYFDDKHRGTFFAEPDGSVKMVTKYFKIKDKDYSDEEDVQVNAERKKKQEQKNKQRSRQNYLRELNALRAFDHPNIVQGVCTNESKLQIVYPYIRGGDLVPLATDSIGLKIVTAGRAATTFNPDQTFLPSFSQQLISAVAHMHSKGFVHLDLKPENFVVAGPDRSFQRFLNSAEMKAYQLVLIDFGLTELVSNLKKDQCMKSGTEVTMGPEQVYCTHGVSFGTDWWGVAASLYRVRVMWEPSIDEKLRGDILFARDPHWGHVVYPMQPFFHKDFTDLLNLMFKPEPKARLFDKHIEKLAEHPYIKLFK